MATETVDELLTDPGDFTDSDEERLDAAEQIGDSIEQLGGIASLRVMAIMNTLGERGVELDAEGSAAREAQLRAIKTLVDGEPGIAEVLEFVRMLTPSMPLQNEVAEAIVTAFNALDGDQAALDTLVPDEPPKHRALCMAEGCKAAVTYRPTASGAGFTVLEREGMALDTVVGIGPNGRPICPFEEHGEMTLADETLPAAEAFALAAEKLNAPVQGDLPGILPVFNYQGCYLELESKAAEVDALHDDYMRAKEEAADAKKAWDKAAELYTKMALEFRRRRQAKGEGDTPTTAAPSVIKCVWDQAHPDDACPLCDTTISIKQRHAIVRVLGAEILPMHANAHADQVVEYRTKLDVQETLDTLAGVIADVHPATVAEWTPDDRAAVRTWASDHDAPFDQMPAVLGRPHIAAAAGKHSQACSECGAVLRTWNEGDGSIVWLSVGARVRTDCPGAEVEPEHHYPDTSKPKKAARATAEPKPKKPRGKARR